MARLTDERLREERRPPDEGRPRRRKAESVRAEVDIRPGRRFRAGLHARRQFPLHTDRHDEEHRLRARAHDELRFTRSLRPAPRRAFRGGLRPGGLGRDNRSRRPCGLGYRWAGAASARLHGAGPARRTSLVRRERGGDEVVRGGMPGLEVIKTTGSRFSGFFVDRFTTLRETEDRILATSIDATWDFPGPSPTTTGPSRPRCRIIPQTFAAARQPQRPADHLRDG